MAVTLQDPVAAYTAATNHQAQLLAVLLTNAGVPARPVDDVSLAG